MGAAAVPQSLAGLSPASEIAAAAAAVCCCCWSCSHSLLCMFLKCAVFVVLICAVRGFFTLIMFPILSPICLFVCHSCVNSRCLSGSVQFLVIFSAFFVCFSYNHVPLSLQSFVSTIQSVVLKADVFSHFFYKNMFFV